MGSPRAPPRAQQDSASQVADIASSHTLPLGCPLARAPPLLSFSLLLSLRRSLFSLDARVWTTAAFGIVSEVALALRAGACDQPATTGCACGCGGGFLTSSDCNGDAVRPHPRPPPGGLGNRKRGLGGTATPKPPSFLTRLRNHIPFDARLVSRWLGLFR